MDFRPASGITVILLYNMFYYGAIYKLRIFPRGCRFRHCLVTKNSCDVFIHIALGKIKKTFKTVSKQANV